MNKNKEMQRAELAILRYTLQRLSLAARKNGSQLCGNVGKATFGSLAAATL